MGRDEGERRAQKGSTREEGGDGLVACAASLRERDGVAGRQTHVNPRESHV
jgi:hypothetical protein